MRLEESMHPPVELAAEEHRGPGQVEGGDRLAHARGAPGRWTSTLVGGADVREDQVFRERAFEARASR